MTALLLCWLALVGIGLDLTRQALTAAGEIAADWDQHPAAELALLTVPTLVDRLPVADALHLIRAGIDASRSRRWNPWKH